MFSYKLGPRVSCAGKLISFIFLMSFLLMSFLLSGCVTYMAEPTPPETAEATATQELLEETTVPGTEQPIITAAIPAVTLDDMPTATPAVSPTMPLGPDLPLRDEEASDEYFSDAVFIGNSLVEGFGAYSGLKTCDVFATTSMSVLGVESAYINSLSQKQYGKIYTLLGINEINFEPEYFKSLYSSMLDRIIEVQPEAKIIIMGLTPVSASKSASGGSFTMDNVNAYNNVLYELAEERGFYYIDLCEALSDETGYLPSSVTTDGIHFSAEHYKVWLEYLKLHYI